MRKKINGEIVAGYTLYLLIGCHAAVFFATLRDGVYWDDAQNPSWQFYVGVLLISAATLGRSWSIKTLGSYHSIQIEIRRNHPLITKGPYRYSRNPYYLSNAMEIVGLPLMANSGIGIALAIVLYWPALWLRIILEEDALQKAIRESFSDYKLKTPRLIPRLGEAT
jgi:protein-S-isoprenylcysteine O-methyltransferase Ste14